MFLPLVLAAAAAAAETPALKLGDEVRVEDINDGTHSCRKLLLDGKTVALVKELHPVGAGGIVLRCLEDEVGAVPAEVMKGALGIYGHLADDYEEAVVDGSTVSFRTFALRRRYSPLAWAGSTAAYLGTGRPRVEKDGSRTVAVVLGLYDLTSRRIKKWVSVGRCLLVPPESDAFLVLEAPTWSADRSEVVIEPNGRCEFTKTKVAVKK